MPRVRFEPTIPASARPQTYGLDRTATGISQTFYMCAKWVGERQFVYS
jgi:hypothetical protein